MEHARLIPFVAVGVEREAPGVLVPEVTDAAEVQRVVPASLQILFASLTGRSQQVRGRGLGLREGIDVTERPVEPDTQPSEFARILLTGVFLDALRCPLPDRRGDLHPARVRVINP